MPLLPVVTRHSCRYVAATYARRALRDIEVITSDIKAIYLRYHLSMIASPIRRCRHAGYAYIRDVTR